MKGDPLDHACVDCGGVAAEWSYVGDAPDERRDAVGVYSTDPAFYVPRCVRCHRLFDLSKTERVSP